MSPWAYLWVSISPFYVTYHPASSSQTHLASYPIYNPLLAQITQYLRGTHRMRSVSVP